MSWSTSDPFSAPDPRAPGTVPTRPKWPARGCAASFRVLLSVVLGLASFAASSRALGAEDVEEAGASQKWSFTVRLFDAYTTGASLGRALSDRTEIQLGLDAQGTSSENWAYDADVKGGGGRLDLAFLWKWTPSDPLRFWIGPAGVLEYSEYRATVAPGSETPPGVLERRSGSLHVAASAELDLVPHVSSVVSVRTPGVTWSREKQTGVFSWIAEELPGIERRWTATQSLQPRIALRIRF